MAATTMVRTTFVAAALLWMSVVVDAAEPELQRLEPHGAQRGTEVEVKLFGVRLNDEPGQLLFSEPGIAATRIEPVDAKQVKAVLRMNEDCRIGRHALRLRTASGLSNLVTFHVGSLKEIEEAEPNDTVDEPQVIPTDVVVNGVVTEGEQDVYAVDVGVNERLSVEIEGIRLGRTLFDPVLELHSSDGTTLASSDDQPAAQQDAFVSIRPKKAGRIFVVVRETAYRGSGAATYCLHVGRFPRPSAVFPPAAVPGQSVKLTWVGNDLDPLSTTVNIPPSAAETYEVLAVDKLGCSPSGLPLHLHPTPPVLEVEPNNGFSEANLFEAPGIACGIISEPKDKDFYRFTMKQGQQWDFRIRARQLRSPLDPVIHIFNADHKYLKGNDDNAGQPDSYLRFKAPADGVYFLDVEDRLLRGRKEMVYVVEATQPEPVVDLTLEERRRYIAQVIPIPQGNRTAAMMTVRRKNFGGPMKVEFDNLPACSEAQAAPLTSGYYRVPVLFSASTDAELNASIATVSAELADKPRPVLSRFRQQTWLVRGRNNIHVWSHFEDSPAIAVTRALPYTVDLIEPKAPLVQGGSIELKIVARRNDGFDGPIGVRTLYNPPGVSTNQSRSIAKDKTEVLIPVTANEKAKVGNWRIVFVGRTNINGAVECSTQLATLKIAEPYFDMKTPTLTVTQGATVDMTVALSQRSPFAGEAELQLLRLPPGVTANKVRVSAESESATFQLVIAADARTGRHRGVGCQAHLTVEGEPVRYSQGYVDLCVDPLPTAKTARRQPDSKGRSS